MNEIAMINEVIAGIESQKDVVVLILAASRRDENDEYVAITDAQKETAMNAAKSVLQCVGAEVAANSTAWIIPAVELAEGETLALNVTGTLTKTTAENNEAQ